MKAWKVIVGATLLAGCSVPGLGTVTPAPNPKTAPESPLIPCRAQLDTNPDTQSLLHGADAQLGDPTLDAGEVANIVSAVTWGAHHDGITCG